MTKPINDRPGGADLTTALPTQRIVTHETVPSEAPASRHAAPEGTAELDSAALDPAALDPAALDPAALGSAVLDPAVLDSVAAGLPDLSAVLATVPGGLGAEVGESFTYAGQRWTTADARPSGTPIGLQLAMEQRGLDGPDGGRVDLPFQRTS